MSIRLPSGIRTYLCNSVTLVVILAFLASTIVIAHGSEPGHPSAPQPSRQADNAAEGMAVSAAADAQNVALIGQIDGSTYAVAVLGNYAYIGVGPRLVILHISNPALPTFVGQTDILPDVLQDIVMTEDYAYVADGNAGLRVVNISTPSNPTEMGDYDTPGYAYGVAVTGGYAYVADGNAGLRVVNISTPSNPTEVGAYDTPGYAYGVAVAGGYAYVADGSAGLRVVNVSTPSNPTEVGDYDTPGYAYGVAVTGGYAYVADGNAGLRVVNISTPSNPTEVGFYDTQGWAPQDVAVAGDYVYVTDDGGAGLFILRYLAYRIHMPLIQCNLPLLSAEDDNYETNEDTPLNVAAPGVLGNDNSYFTPTAVLDTTTTNGALTFQTDGSFTYTPAPNFNGTDTFTYHISDGRLDSSPATVTIVVNVVDDPGTIAVPSAQSMTMNSSLALSTGGGNLISVDGNDGNPAELLQLTLTATNGTLTLASFTGLNFVTGDGTADATMTFSGQMSDINAALDGMIFTPAIGYAGATMIDLTLTDNDDGSSTARNDTAALTVNIDPPPVIIVNDTADNLTADGYCTLREAIQAANTGGPVDGCIAQSYTTISIPPGTYTLALAGAGKDANASGDLDITAASLTIQGSGAGSTILDGGAIDRVLHIMGGGTVAIYDLTLTNGNVNGEGGGLFVDASTVTVKDCTIEANQTTGTPLHHGGAIFNNQGTLTVRNTTLSGNQASGADAQAGAIHNNDGTVTLEGCALIGNSASNHGGALVNQGTAPQMTLTNCTISGNCCGIGQFGGGIYHAAGTLNVNSCTIYGNVEHGIFNEGTLNIRNSILSANTDNYNNPGGGTLNDFGYNLAEGEAADFVEPTDITILSPNLGSLQDNGGPTFTHALLAGSPCIDAIPGPGCNGGPATDQRGVARPQNGNCDIGAYEFP